MGWRSGGVDGERLVSQDFCGILAHKSDRNKGVVSQECKHAA